MAVESSPSISWLVRVSPSMYFIMSSSSASTTRSQMASRAASAAATYCSGISKTSTLPLASKRLDCMRMTSMMPSNSSPTPMGSVTGARRLPNLSVSMARVSS